MRASPAIVRRATAVMALAAFFASSSQAAWLTVETSEWYQWPEYCRAKYADGPRAKEFPLSKTIPPATIERWKNTLGKETWTTVHHYCGSLMYLQRAANATTEVERQRKLRAAEVNALHSIERVSPGSPLWNDMQTTLALIRAQRAVTQPVE